MGVEKFFYMKQQMDINQVVQQPLVVIILINYQVVHIMLSEMMEVDVLGKVKVVL